MSPAPSPYEISEAGAGPRHFEFHPNGKFAYLMEEMSGSVSVYAYRDGQLTLLQNISAIPPTYAGDIGSADIHVSPDGNYVYASNRGASNTIAIFAVNKNGTLKSIGHQSTHFKHTGLLTAIRFPVSSNKPVFLSLLKITTSSEFWLATNKKFPGGSKLKLRGVFSQGRLMSN